MSYVDDAYWQDVLDARYAGPTEAYTQINGAFGMQFAKDKITATIKVINLINEEIQSHVFGDIIKRQILGELRFVPGVEGRTARYRSSGVSQLTNVSRLRVDVAEDRSIDPFRLYPIEQRHHAPLA